MGYNTNLYGGGTASSLANASSYSAANPGGDCGLRCRAGLRLVKENAHTWRCTGGAHRYYDLDGQDSNVNSANRNECYSPPVVGETGRKDIALDRIYSAVLDVKLEEEVENENGTNEWLPRRVP